MDLVSLCPFRRDVSKQDAEEYATCNLLVKACGTSDARLVRVRRDACAACCQAASQSHSRFNHVLASLLYHRTHQLLEDQPSLPDADRFVRLKHEARSKLLRTSGLVNPSPDALGVLSVGERRLAGARLGPERQLSWAIAILTAPRQIPTLSATLTSLREAGFDRFYVFAEPQTVLPRSSAELQVRQHRQRQGQLRSFFTAAQTLLEQHPNADCYAVFEDDIVTARGLRHWCDREFWPGGHEIVSLFTSRVFCDDRVGWQTLNLGHYRTFGAQALVFQREVLRQLLADADMHRHVMRGHPAADAIVGEWALKRGIGIAYHSPSLVQHTGTTTAMTGHEMGRVGRAIAVGDVEQIATWRREKPRWGQVGLVGWNAPTGLGYLNRDIAVHLPLARWLVPPHFQFAQLEKPPMRGEYRTLKSRWLPQRSLRALLKGLDWVLFAEHPYLPDLVQHAREMGISVACIPMWEWLDVDLTWLLYVDLMICPTRTCYDMLCQWRRDLGFGWDVVYAPWPIDGDRFPFRQRKRCREFLFINGTAGVRARRLDGSLTPYRRKGVELIAATARILRTVPFLVYSQARDLPTLPANVVVKRPPKNNSDLYHEGDVCVQPSHWEGLGLQLLECQAAGMPLVTTDAPPMNECQPFRAIRADETEVVFGCGDQAIDSQLVEPKVLAELLDEIYYMDIGEASRQARSYIERERSWPRLHDLLSGLLTA